MVCELSSPCAENIIPYSSASAVVPGTFIFVKLAGSVVCSFSAVHLFSLARRQVCIGAVPNASAMVPVIAVIPAVAVIHIMVAVFLRVHFVVFCFVAVASVLCLSVCGCKQ